MTAKAAGIGDQFNSLEESKSYKIGIKNPTGKGKKVAVKQFCQLSGDSWLGEKWLPIFIRTLEVILQENSAIRKDCSNQKEKPATSETSWPIRWLMGSHKDHFYPVVANALLTYEEMVNILARPQLHENITQHFWQTSSKENPHQLQYRKKWYKNESRRCYIFLFRYKIL
ncbi:hypothetical protein QE152_g39568 [Popillia japonica]|uniref:Uncharacterized protein n=1 Tax=Popillia japonica TaxID=7064 RepID=A0AAW1HTP5_POPJA